MGKRSDEGGRGGRGGRGGKREGTSLKKQLLSILRGPQRVKAVQ